MKKILDDQLNLIHNLGEKFKVFNIEKNSLNNWASYIMNCSVRENPDLAEITQGAFVELAREKEIVVRLIAECKEYIDMLLEQDADDTLARLIEFIDQDWIPDICRACPEIWVLFQCIEIYEKEMASGSPFCILEGRRSLREMVDLFNKVVFYYRRLEVNLPMELQEEFVPFIREENLSGIALSFILLNGNIKDKERVKNQINELWRRMYHESK